MISSPLIEKGHLITDEARISRSADTVTFAFNAKLKSGEYKADTDFSMMVLTQVGNNKKRATPAFPSIEWPKNVPDQPLDAGAWDAIFEVKILP